MNQPVSKSSLSARHIRLIELCHERPFCRVERLQVQDGEPLFTPATTIIQKFRMGGDNSPRAESALPDFWLKRQMIELLDIMRELGNGEIRSIEVAHGLPMLVEIESQPAFAGADRHA